MTNVDASDATKFFNFVNETSDENWQAFIDTRDDQEHLHLMKKVAQETDLDTFLVFVMNDEMPAIQLSEEELALLQGGTQGDYNLGRKVAQALKAL